MMTYVDKIFYVNNYVNKYKWDILTHLTNLHLYDIIYGDR